MLEYMNKNTKYIEFSQFEGKMPPTDIELEKIVLGSFLLEKSSLGEYGHLLSTEIFSLPSHVEICRAILQLHTNKEPVDIISVTNKLRAESLLEFVGGSYYVAGLLNRVGSNANIEYHLRILYQKAIQRKTIAVGYDLIKDGYNDLKDCFEALEQAEIALKSILTSAIQSENELVPFSDLIKLEYEASEALAKGINTGVKCGLRPIDNAFGGFGKGTLTYIAARPSVGKSVLARNIGKGAAKTGGVVSVFSLEMSSLEYIQCMAADEANVSLEKITKGKSTDEERNRINEALGKINSIKLFVDDKASNTVKQMWSKCAKIKNTFGLDMIIIDYLQLIPAPELPPHTNDNARLEYISRNLKLMAKDLDVPVIVLCQLNRDVEKRKENQYRPILSDLRGSGCLDGDTIIQCPSLKTSLRIIDLVGRKQFDIFATDYKKTIKMKAKSAFVSGTKEVYKITLLNGQSISATINHKFLKQEGWVALEDLSTFDKIAIPISYGDDKFDTTPSSEVSLVGHFLSNGSALKGKPIRYCQNIEDVDLTDIVIRDAMDATNNRVSPKYVDTILEKSKFRTIFFKATFHLTHGKTNPVGDILKKYGLWDVRTKEKHIPDALFYLSHKNTYTLLRALFSGDGTVYYAEKDGRKSLKISYSSASLRLIMGVQQLLAKVGIISFVTKHSNKKNNIWYNLQISGKSNIQIFVDKIGFYNSRKNKIMLDGWEQSKSIIAGWNKYDYNEQRTLCFMPIKSIQFEGEKQVFDIEVPELHNFVANNIIVHNSIEQDADNVILLYRPEKHEIIEDVNGNPYETGYSEGIIAKFRLGELGIMKFKFEGQYQRFSGLNETFKPLQPNISFDSNFQHEPKKDDGEAPF